MNCPTRYWSEGSIRAHNWLAWTPEGRSYFGCGIWVTLGFWPLRKSHWQLEITIKHQVFMEVSHWHEYTTPLFKALIHPFRNMRPFKGWIFGSYKVQHILEMSWLRLSAHSWLWVWACVFVKKQRRTHPSLVKCWVNQGRRIFQCVNPSPE